VVDSPFVPGGSVLVGLAAHHDDLVIGAGGFLLGESEHEEVALVVLASEYVTGDGADRIRWISGVAGEYRWRIEVLDFRDCAIPVTLEAALRVGRLLARLEPTRLVVPNGGRHMDHAAAFTLAQHALRFTQLEPELLVCDAYKGSLASSEHLAYRDIGEVYDKKIDMVGRMGIEEHGDHLVEYTRLLARLRGMEANREYAESFLRMDMSPTV
jgi:LmbE family N-acetylglucosaminyl deacetylase